MRGIPEGWNLLLLFVTNAISVSYRVEDLKILKYLDMVNFYHHNF